MHQMTTFAALSRSYCLVFKYCKNPTVVTQNNVILETSVLKLYALTCFLKSKEAKALGAVYKRRPHKFAKN